MELCSGHGIGNKVSIDGKSFCGIWLCHLQFRTPLRIRWGRGGYHAEMDASPAIQIREAGVEDVAVILGFIQELAEYEKLSHEVVATEALLREHLFGGRRVAEARIAEVGGQPMGYALFFRNFSAWLGRPGIYLEDIYVRPAARGKGVGTALLREVARVAVQRGCGRLEWAVLDWNESAIEFYERMGARV